MRSAQASITVRTAARGQRREGRRVVRREADDLATTDPGPLRPQRLAVDEPRLALEPMGERREAVLEDDDVVVGGRDLGRHGAAAGRAERALVLRRQEGPVVAVRGDGHPLAGQDVVAQARPAAGCRELARVRDVPGRAAGEVRLGVVEVDDLAAVGEAGRGLARCRPGRARGCRGRRSFVAHQRSLLLQTRGVNILEHSCSMLLGRVATGSWRAVRRRRFGTLPGSAFGSGRAPDLDAEWRQLGHDPETPT